VLAIPLVFIAWLSWSFLKRATIASADEIFAQSSPAVVQILAQDGEGRPTVFGSGFFVTTQGLVATNYHVIKKAYSANVVLDDKTTRPIAGVAALDEKADLAILAVGGSVTVRSLELAEETPAVGTRVYAIGTPLGVFANTLSDGLVSGHHETEGITYIQTTAPISPGSSGGPLLRADGRVVGVTTLAVRDAQNINLAVPASQLARLLAGCDTDRRLARFPLSRYSARALGGRHSEIYELTTTDITKVASFHSTHASIFGVMLDMSPDEVEIALHQHRTITVKKDTAGKTWEVRKDGRSLMRLVWKDGCVLKIHFWSQPLPYFQGNSNQLVELHALDDASSPIRSFLGVPSRVINELNGNVLPDRLATFRYCYHDQGIEIVISQRRNGCRVDLVLVKRPGRFSPRYPLWTVYEAAVDKPGFVLPTIAAPEVGRVLPLFRSEAAARLFIEEDSHRANLVPMAMESREAVLAVAESFERSGVKHVAIDLLSHPPAVDTYLSQKPPGVQLYPVAEVVEDLRSGGT
jgi:hypothetical protein